MADEWRKLPPDGTGIPTWVKVHGDGTITARRAENIKPNLDAHKAMRKETSRHRDQLMATEAKGTPLRYIGGMDRLLYGEMMRECGHDQDKQRSFIRDHADEVLCVPKSSTKLPGKKVYSFPESKRGK